MRLIAMKCTQCGAALPPRSRWSVIDCSYCHARMVLDGSNLVAREEYRAAAAAIEGKCAAGAVRIDGGYYALAPKAIRGEHGDVHAGWRRAPLPEAVWVKIARDAAGAEALQAENEALTALQADGSKGAEYFSTLIPEPVAFGKATGGALNGRTALVLRRRSGFVETLEDAAAATRGEPRHAVWIWKRLLEILDWAHRAGRTHGAVIPRRVVIHARDHGVMLVGWAASTALTDTSNAAADDLKMAAECVAFALTGKRNDAGKELPGPLKVMLTSFLDGTAHEKNAWALRDMVSMAARQAYGEPKFVDLKSPAWKAG